MKLPKKIKASMKKYLLYSIILVFIFLFLLLFKINVAKIAIIILLIIVGCICKIYKQFTSISIGFELVTPITILFAYQVGIFFAISSAILMVIASEFISGKMNGFAVGVQIIIYIILSIIAGLFNFMPFVGLALFLIIFRNITMWFVMVLMGFVDPFRATMATVPNIFINGFLINSIGLFFIALL